MTPETAREKLKSFQYDHQYYLEKMREVEKFKEETQNVLKRLSASRELVSSQKLKNKLTELVEKQAEEEEVIVNILNKKQTLEREINLLPQPYKTVMYMRYIRFLTFDQIADRMNYSSKRIYQLHAKGLELYAGLPLA